MLTLVKASTDFSCSAEIRSALRRRIGERKLTDILSASFADGTFEAFRADVLAKTTDGADSPMLPYVVFLERLSRERAALLAYESALSPSSSFLPKASKKNNVTGKLDCHHGAYDSIFTGAGARGRD